MYLQENAQLDWQGKVLWTVQCIVVAFFGRCRWRRRRRCLSYEPRPTVRATATRTSRINERIHWFHVNGMPIRVK